MKAPGAVKTGEIEMLAGIVLKNSKKAGVFRKVKISAPADIVKLAKGSLGTAGNAKITGLTTQKTYSVQTGKIVKYSSANGTLVDENKKAALNPGTEITGLTNGKTYLVKQLD